MVTEEIRPYKVKGGYMIELEYLTLVKIHVGIGFLSWLSIAIYQGCKVSDYELIAGLKRFRIWGALACMLVTGIFTPAIIFGIYLGQEY